MIAFHASWNRTAKALFWSSRVFEMATLKTHKPEQNTKSIKKANHNFFLSHLLMCKVDILLQNTSLNLNRFFSLNARHQDCGCTLGSWKSRGEVCGDSMEGRTNHLKPSIIGFLHSVILERADPSLYVKSLPILQVSSTSDSDFSVIIIDFIYFQLTGMHTKEYNLVFFLSFEKSTDQ